MFLGQQNILTGGVLFRMEVLWTKNCHPVQLKEPQPEERKDFEKTVLTPSSYFARTLN